MCIRDRLLYGQAGFGPIEQHYDFNSIFLSPENVIVLGESVFVNFEICSSISFSIVRCACSSGNSQITVEMWGVCELRHAVKRTPSALPMSSGHRVCKIDSNNSHSSVEGKVLIKILVNIITLFFDGKTLDRF